MAQKGEAITGDAMAKYTRHHEEVFGTIRVCIVDDYIAHEWSYIPPSTATSTCFNATSFTASSALAGEGRRSRGEEARRSHRPADQCRSIC
jgi:hypothetical protein